MRLLQLPVVLLLALSPALTARQDVPTLVAELAQAGDNGAPERVEELAGLRTPEALAGLLEIYPAMQSIYMRRAVLRGLALYEDLDGMSHRALEAIMDAATLSSEAELREIAVDQLARCTTNGRPYLRMIVDAPTEDHVRELAMEHLAADPRRDEEAWFERLYTGVDPAAGSQKKNKKGRKDEQVEERRVRPLPELRELAFEALSRWLDDDALLKAMGDPSPLVRMRALEMLEGRGHESVVEAAERIYSRGGNLAEYRLSGARILSRRLGADVVPRFLEDGGRRDWPLELILGLADIVAGFKDDASTKAILKGVGKGKDRELLFSVLAARAIDDPKVDKALVKLLREKESRLRTRAAELLAERGYQPALEPLQKALEKTEDPLELAAYFKALGTLRAGQAAWLEELMTHARGDVLELRNAALTALGEVQDPSAFPLLVEALSDDAWSTRLAAARALSKVGSTPAVGALCERIAKEDGRLAVEMGGLLFELTGKPYGPRGRQWQAWWEQEGATFQPISAKELREARRLEEARRLKEVSRGSFFGIKIESTRVIFIVDVSGSMEERTRGRYVGEDGETRIVRAKEELARAIDSLERGALFNVIVFSGRAEAWSEEIQSSTEEKRAEALDYVNRLRAGGGTNLHGALRLAFDDGQVDTIYVISDGEPSAGDVTDPSAIRDDVALWNEHRGVVIHSIAVGGSFRVLEWLAADSGGSYVKFP